MDDARTLGLADLLPQDHLVGLDRTALLLGRQLVEGTVVGPTLKRRARLLVEHGVGSPQGVVQRPLAQPETALPLFDQEIGQLGVDRRRHVAGQGPGCGGPDQQVLTRALPQREAEEDAGVGQLPVALGDDLVLADARAAATAPGHHVAALVDPTLVVALFQGRPDAVVVLVTEGKVAAAHLWQAQSPHEQLDGVGHRTVGSLDGDDLGRIFRHPGLEFAQHVKIVPVHPVAEAHRLLRLDCRVLEHALFAHVDKRIQAIGFDVPLALEAQLLLHLDLDPEALAVEAVLLALVVAAHGLIALEHVLEGTPPGMVHAHRVVGGDGTIYEREPGTSPELFPELFESASALPEVEYLVLLFDKINLVCYWLEHCFLLRNRVGSGARVVPVSCSVQPVDLRVNNRTGR